MLGVRSRSSGVRRQEIGVRNQEIGLLEIGVRRQLYSPHTPHPTPYTPHPTPCPRKNSLPQTLLISVHTLTGTNQISVPVSIINPSHYRPEFIIF
ncbi:hypothetical protein [Microcystis sp. M53602_WE12]|uniref:hypothetical protein n=1 Tax=Microcystis sp. M53602_WE12 TaxID=3030674 RepID=UPI0008FFC026|nr:hypothetical protein [Microcystis sp. M53602_WE12]MDJ0603874.1 hypothetical protein [Microcystis sp. M53602_WE12]